MTKKDISEKLKRVVEFGGAVGEETMAPSGTWCTTFGPDELGVIISVSGFFNYMATCSGTGWKGGLPSWVSNLL
jgi:hypothetical protein